MKKILEFAHKLIIENVTDNDVTLDMTIGNGNDTLFLVKVSKFVYGFDIQKQACDNTRTLLKDYNNFKIINDNHENFSMHVNVPFKGVIFNLGFLPKSSRSITTKAQTTLNTVKKVLENIEFGGIVVIVVYPGHLEGYQESIILTEFLQGLDQKEYEVLKYDFINQINYPPYLLAIKKRK